MLNILSIMGEQKNIPIQEDKRSEKKTDENGM